MLLHPTDSVWDNDPASIVVCSSNHAHESFPLQLRGILLTLCVLLIVKDSEAASCTFSIAHSLGGLSVKVPFPRNDSASGLLPTVISSND